MAFNNNKSVTDNDVKTFLMSKNVTLTDEDAQEVIKDCDTNNNRSFNLKKFVNLLKRLKMPGGLLFNFQLFDSNNDGILSIDDLRKMLSLISYEPCTQQDAIDIMKKYTSDENGMVYKDFEKMMLLE